jgi:hypothetical protein
MVEQKTKKDAFSRGAKAVENVRILANDQMSENLYRGAGF